MKTSSQAAPRHRTKCTRRAGADLAVLAAGSLRAVGAVGSRRCARLARVIVRRRWLVIGDLDRADALRRVLRRPGLEALVRVVLDPRLLGVRGEPADAQDVRHRRATRRSSPSSTATATSRRRPAIEQAIAAARRGQPGLARSARSSRPAAAPTSRRTATRRSPRSTRPGTPGFSSDRRTSSRRARSCRRGAPPGVDGVPDRPRPALRAPPRGGDTAARASSPRR